MKTIRFIIIVSISLMICSFMTSNKAKDTQEKEVQLQEPSLRQNNELVLTENTFGDFQLEKGIPLEELKLKEIFSDFNVTKRIGKQDGPDFYCYDIGTQATLKTIDTKNETFFRLWIHGESKVSDTYGTKLGMTYNDVMKRRPAMNISTEHNHIYLVEKGSNIAYEILLEDYNGPDKEEYSLEEVKNNDARVIGIIWY